jgi:hypothetical protein
MKLETSCVHIGKEILPKPGHKQRQRSQASRKETQQEGSPVTQTAFQQSTITLPESFERDLETLL